MTYRENRDLASLHGTKTICLAALSGNGRVDVTKSSSNVSNFLNDARDLMFPYLVTFDEEEDIETKDYDRYFKILKEMEEARKQEELNAGSDSPEDL